MTKEPTYKLKEGHPSYQKLLSLQDFAYKLGISVHFGTEFAVLKDGNIEYRIDGIEGELFRNFPIETEFKITII